MPGWQVSREGKPFSCKACGEDMMSSPRFDGPFPFCARKRCIKKRAKRVQQEMENEKNQGGPALPIRRT